jgi:hypothetical protein
MKPSDPAFPITEVSQYKMDNNYGMSPCAYISKGGLSIRQLACLVAMNGLLNKTHESESKWQTEYIAKVSCEYADAVLKAEEETRDE